jgi:hypothetical protein
MPIDSKECFTSLTTDGQLYEIYLAAQANGGGDSFGAVYYFNRSNASSISGYYEMSKNLVIGAGTTLTATGAGTQLVGSFATVLNNPNVTTIPSGNWNFENYVSMNSNGGTPKIYGEIYSRNLAGTETLIATNISNPHTITDGTVNELYLWSIPVPATNILATDRIVVKFYALNLGGRTMTMHFEDASVAQATTSLPSVDLSAYVLKAGDTMTGKLNLPASTTSSAPLNLGNGTAPTSGSSVPGDLFFDGSLRYRDNALTTRSVAATNKTNAFTDVQTITVSNSTNAGLTVTQNGNGGGVKIVNPTGTGESLRIEDESPESTPFVVSGTGRVGIGTAPDATVGLKLDLTGIKFNDGTIQTTAATSGVTSVTATAPIQSTGGTTPVISTTQSGAASDGYLSSTDWNKFTDKVYCISLGHSSVTLDAGGTNVFFSNIFDLGPVTTYNRRQFKVPFSGTIIAASLSFYNGGGATPAGHSGATMSLYNVDTNATVASLINYNVDGIATLNLLSQTATGLTIAVVAGTTYNIYLQAGTFSTNPTSVRQVINLFIK